MSGNKIGGAKARETMTARDPLYYQKMGRLGGKATSGYKFAHGKISASAAGKLGGRPSKEVFFVVDESIDSNIIEPSKQPWYKGWLRRQDGQS